MRWTEDQLRAYEMRNAPALRQPAPEDSVSIESDLHDQIKQECKHRGWLCLTGSMAHRSHRTVGEPDMIVVADGGRVYFAELKRKGGKPTPEQDAIIAWLNRLGAKAKVIYSLSEFCDWTTSPAKTAP